MGERTTIAWTDYTFNPWWGCLRCSPGCEHCYAETWAKRVGQNVWGPAETTPRRELSAKYWERPKRWDRVAAREGRRSRVFCASMADVFEDHPQLPPLRARLWDLIRETRNLDWQLLTKRPENILEMVPLGWRRGFPANIWVGASAEDQTWLDRRTGSLLAVPAAVRFMSCEPLLGPLSFFGADQTLLGPNGIDWIIVGGESGPGARPMDLDWARRIVREAKETGTPVFVKQLGAAHAPERHDAKGERWECWPEHLRVREFPASQGGANDRRFSNTRCLNS